MNPKIKISQLPAKGANLAGADLLEIAEFTGTGYISKSITGQEIIDAAAGAGGVTDVTATAPIESTGGTTPDISIRQSGSLDDGYLSSADWIAFNNKQDALTLTTTGTSGAATLVGSTLNIPQYSGGGTNTLKFTSLQLTDGASITNTATDTITYSVLIPANTFTSRAYFDFTSRLTKTGTASAWNVRLYKNTANTLTGATLIGTLGSNITNTFTYTQNLRNLRVEISTMRFYSATTASASDFVNQASVEGSTTFNLAVDNYILVAASLNGAFADVITGRMCKILGYE